MSPRHTHLGMRQACNVATRTKTERRIAILKDLALFTGGLSGIAYQQITQDVNIFLLLVFTAMTGVPGLTNILSLLRNSPSVLDSSSPQQQPPAQESGSASRNLPGASQ